MNRHRIHAITLLLALTLSLLLPTVLSQGPPEASDNFISDRQDDVLVKGTTLRVCADPQATVDLGRMQVTHRADPVFLNTTADPDRELFNHFEHGIEIPVDDDQCITVTTLADPNGTTVFLDNADEDDWAKVDQCFCLNQSGRWSVRYIPQSLGATFVYRNFTVIDPLTSNVNQTTTLSGTNTDLATDLLEKTWWLAFAIVFLFNRWAISGTFFIVGGVATEIIDFGITDAFLFVMGAMFVLVEWFIITRLPEIHQRIRSAFSTTEGDL